MDANGGRGYVTRVDSPRIRSSLAEIPADRKTWDRAILGVWQATTKP